MDMSKGHTRSGAGRGVSQANEAAICPKFKGWCQHEIVSENYKKWKQCGTVRASYGCLVGHVCVGGRPYLRFCPVILQHFSFRS